MSRTCSGDRQRTHNISFLLMTLAPMSSLLSYNLYSNKLWKTFITTQPNKVRRNFSISFNSACIALWNSRVFFCTTPVKDLDNWIPSLLAQWPAELDQVEIHLESHSVSVKRLDGRWPWVQAISDVLGETTSYPVVNYGDGCASDSSLPANITGHIALVSNLQNSTCYWSEKFINAELAGAVGVIVYNDKDSPLIDINCRKPSCYLTLIPVTMITYEDGSLIMKELAGDKPVTVQVGRFCDSFVF